MSKKRKDTPTSFSIIYKGIRLDVGLGGIHACIKEGKYTSSDTHVILDVDVAGYYPTIAVEYNLYPQHLGITYVEVLKDNIAERARYPKGTSINTGLKLANNGTFGASNDKYSPIYDPKYTYAVTCNGQLLLLRLIEDLFENINDITLVQANTDGITVILNRRYESDFQRICKNWEVWSKMVLEYTTYSTMYIKDVNNYIAVSDKGKVKLKGEYELDKEIYKNQSMRVVKLAVYNYLIKGIPIESTIRKHSNIFDFKKSIKINKSFVLEYHTIVDYKEHITKLSKNTRYLVTKGSGSLYKRKVSTNKLTGIDTGKTVTPFNIYDSSKPMDKYRIDYEYYIAEAYSLVQPFITKQLALW